MRHPLFKHREKWGNACDYTVNEQMERKKKMNFIGWLQLGKKNEAHL